MSLARNRVKEADADSHSDGRGCSRTGFGVYSGCCNVNTTFCTPITYRQITTSPGNRLQRFHSFLRRLRAGGRSNMYGALPYLMRRFDLDRDTAFRVICDWVDAQDAAAADSVPREGAPRLSSRTSAPARVSRKRSRTRG